MTNCLKLILFSVYNLYKLHLLNAFVYFDILKTGTVSKCPSTDSTAVCSGHGSCAGSSTWVCTCHAGYTGTDCSLRSCSFSPAWFDEATNTNTGKVFKSKERASAIAYMESTVVDIYIPPPFLQNQFRCHHLVSPII